MAFDSALFTDVTGTRLRFSLLPRQLAGQPPSGHTSGSSDADLTCNSVGARVKFHHDRVRHPYHIVFCH